MSSHEIDTIVLGVPCTIKYDYQPYEAADTGPEAQYPGCPEEIDITSVSVGGVCIDEWLDGSHMILWMHEAVQEAIRNRREQWMEDVAEDHFYDESSLPYH